MTSAASAWLRDQARPVRALLGTGIAAGLLQAALMCLGAWMLAHVLAGAIFHGRRWSMAWPWLLALLALAALRFALGLLQRRATFEAGARVADAVRQALEKRMRELGPRWGTRQASGDLATRLVDGVDALVPYYAGYLPQVAFAVLVPALILLVVLPADPWSALVLVFTAPLVPLFMVLAGQAAEQASQRRWMRLRRMGAHFMDALAGLTTLRLYRAATREQALLEATGEAYRRETMAVLRIAFLSALVLEFFATVSIAVLAVLIGFRLMWGKLAFEQGLFVLLLAPEFFLPLRALGTQRHRRMDAAAAATDLVEWLTVQPPQAAQVASPSPIAATQLTIDFERVGFAHEDGRALLRDLDLHLPAGTSLTLVGASGSGKSTLLSLLMGFDAPQSGRILVDGHDLACTDLDAWRRHIAWIPQRAHVFHGSLRDNLLIAAADADTFTLWRALQAASLDGVVARLPQGLDTPLGERGHGLSGGECQRLALARGWLRNAPLLLLDEPTQHLDDATAASIHAALARLGEGRTVIRITHRLDGIRDDEHVAVLAEGHIVEHGRADALRAAGGHFAGLLAAEQAA